MLVQTLFGVAVAFVSQGAHFLAAVQVIVYAGAIVVLFLFVIMLLGVDREEAIDAEPLRNQWLVAHPARRHRPGPAVAPLGPREWTTGAPSVVGPLGGPAANVEDLARRPLHALPVRLRSNLCPARDSGCCRRGPRPPARAEDDLDADLIEASAAEDVAALAAVEPAAPMDEPDPEPDPEPDTENVEVPSP